MGPNKQFYCTLQGVSIDGACLGGSPFGQPKYFRRDSTFVLILAVMALSVFVNDIVNSPAMAGFGRNVPVALDVQNPPGDNLYFTVKPYMVAVRQRIQQAWRPNVLSPSYRTKIQFQINHEGQIFAPQLVSSSGNEKFDQRAMSAVLACSPFQPIPIETLIITAAFDNRYLTPAELDQNVQRYRFFRQQQLVREQLQPTYYQSNLAQQNNRYVEQNYGAQIPISSNRQPPQAELMDPATDGELRGAPQNKVDSVPDGGVYQPGRGTSDEANKFAYSEPKTKSELVALSPDELENYKTWFNNEWSKEPPERRFYFLTGLKYSSTPVKRVVVKGRKPK